MQGLYSRIVGDSRLLGSDGAEAASEVVLWVFCFVF